MNDEILINDVDIENVKKEFEIYINKIATVNQYLKNELEASFVLLSAARKNIDIICDKYEEHYPDLSELYQKFSDDINSFENELASHLAARNVSET
ncbi:hypothetical protein [Fluviispira vulneris]|uniref:hypothetical protein n=1 Tax=Fluviispira vulneris TaxID=2763012 RepID=UPI001646415D|nr:hypothetical protein [Fluviispira vulneris]